MGALTQDELALLGDAEKARELFLQHDPRAGDIWPNDMKKLRSERVERMEEARKLGEDIERIKEAKAKVQTALEALKVKLREAETQAAIDPGGVAENTVSKLREILCVEEPKLVQLLNEKQQQYELDYSRLSELKRELAHLKHGEEKLSAAIQTEFAHWLRAVEERYPGRTKPSVSSAAVSSSTAPQTSSSRTPPPLPRAQASSSPASTPAASASPCSQAAPVQDGSTGAPSALAKAEAALQSLRERLEEARQSGDTQRQQMLEQLLATEEPRLARLRTAQS